MTTHKSEDYKVSAVKLPRGLIMTVSWVAICFFV